jgi:hypothetical protein
MTTIKAMRPGFGGHGNQCPGREWLFHRGDHPSAIPGPCRFRSNAGVVDIGDVRGGAHNSSGFVRIVGDLQAGGVCIGAPWVRSPAPCNCLMPESVCLSVILGNALGRSLSLFSNSSWRICFTDPGRITT